MTFEERYLELGLRLGRHADELVDSYFGPPALARRVADEPLRDPAALAEDADELLAGLDVDDAARRRWLEGQIRALGTLARKFAGTVYPYSEEVERCYGVRPRWYDESDFERAHVLLDEALPGEGDTPTRYARWFEETTVPVDKLPAVLDSLTQEFRSRTRELVGLPDGEDVELELVSNRRWFGFAHALGNLRSRILVNTDLPFAAGDLAHFLTHEIYPGHHTEGAWKEAVLVRERGRVELTMQVLWAPEAVIAEGIAELAEEILVGDGGHEIVAEHLERLGIAYDADIGARIAATRRVLGKVVPNLGLLKHERGAGDDELLEYARRWSLQPEYRIQKMVESQNARQSPGYVVCYPEGLRLARGFVRGDRGRFKQLLVEQLVPADLDGQAAVDERPARSSR